MSLEQAIKVNLILAITRPLLGPLLLAVLGLQGAAEVQVAIWGLTAWGALTMILGMRAPALARLAAMLRAQRPIAALSGGFAPA